MSDGHGIDVADLAVLPLLALAAWLVWPRRRRVARASADPAPATARPAPEWSHAAPIEVLIICSANQCRSPMAAELLARCLQVRGVSGVVRSAGTTAEAGLPALGDAQAAVSGLESHRAVPLDVRLVERADLVLGMTRHHAREAVLIRRDALTRTFTVFELARRGRAAGPRRWGESVEQWLTRVGAGRTLADFAGTNLADELQDPLGSGASAVARSAAELDAALDEIANLVWGTAAAVSADVS
jgi:protein-tyrosine phosphatase